MFINPLMSQHFFGQPYLDGLLLIRQNLGWFSFFMFIVFIKDNEDVEKTITLLTLLVGFWVVLLLVTKWFPQLGVIQIDPQYYIKNPGMIRFGEKRLFFPYGSIPIFIYCISLARFLHAPRGERWTQKVLPVSFFLVAGYAVLSTYTRALSFSLVVLTTYALLNCRRRILKYTAVGITVLVVSLQALILVSGADIPFLQETKLGKLILQSSDLPRETGRKFEALMCVTHFLKSPITGVGTLRNLKDTDEIIGVTRTYRKYGYFSGADIGFLKIAAEYGLLGISWVAWFFSYSYRKSKRTLAMALKKGDTPIIEAVARGQVYFLIYLFVSGFTIAHFILPSGLHILALSLALMAITRVSMESKARLAVTPKTIHHENAMQAGGKLYGGIV